jgi:hypothetical protein
MPHGTGTPVSAGTPRSLRQAYLEWVEAQVEDFKDSIPRSRLLDIADQVVTELRTSRGGQYQLTEVLLCDAMNRHLFQLLKLPGYRAWCEQRAREPLHPPADARVIPFRELAPPPSITVVRPGSAVADAEEAVACV